jgi:hypothetical protein
VKILCKLPNAADVINGVKFFEHKLGMLSEEIEEDVAAVFLKIEGYVRVLPGKSEAPGAGAAATAPAAPVTSDDKAAPAAPPPAAPSGTDN